MSTYAVQVPVGRELDVKARLVKALELMGNPGIIAIHALETFEQTLSLSGMSCKRWKAKLPGYIFVTTENAGFRMDASCWQLIRHIPMVRKILDQAIPHDELRNFFDNVDLEPEIQIVETPSSQKNKPSKKELKKYWENLVDAHTAEPVLSTTTEQQAEESPIATLIEAAAGTMEAKVKEARDQAAAGLNKLVSAVTTVVRGNKTTHIVPLKLYKILIEQYRKGRYSTAKTMTVQSALHELKTLLKAVVQWRT